MCINHPNPPTSLTLFFLGTGPDVQFEEIAKKCEDCTGADIKSLLVNAQLEAVHDLMDRSALYKGI